MEQKCWYDDDNCTCADDYRASLPSPRKRVVTVASLALLVWLIGALALVGGLTVYDRVANPTEDSGNPLLHCYIYGDGDCGPNAPWHGFINLF